MKDITVLILTLNEERHIERCVRSALQLATCVFVIDSFSTDKTVSIAELHGARVWQRGFRNHADQLAWALNTLPIATPWVMRMDADEVLTPALASELSEALSTISPHINGFLVPLYVRFQGKLIRFGGYPQWQLRVWRRGKAAIEQRWMDEKIVVRDGGVQRLRGPYIDDNLNTITWWTSKHNAYASREAIDLLNKRYHFLPVAHLSDQDSHFGGQRVRWLKDNVYSRLPRGWRVLLYYMYRMILRLGILDGSAGVTFHTLQGFWYRFLVDVKVGEVEREMRFARVDCVEAIRRRLGVDPLS